MRHALGPLATPGALPPAMWWRAARCGRDAPRCAPLRAPPRAATRRHGQRGYRRLSKAALVAACVHVGTWRGFEATKPCSGQRRTRSVAHERWRAKRATSSDSARCGDTRRPGERCGGTRRPGERCGGTRRPYKRLEHSTRLRYRTMPTACVVCLPTLREGSVMGAVRWAGCSAGCYLVTSHGPRGGSELGGWGSVHFVGHVRVAARSGRQRRLGQGAGAQPAL